MLAEFLSTHYQRVSDDLDLPFSTEGAERLAQVALLTGWLVADDHERPRWNPGDFFGATFGRH